MECRRELDCVGSRGGYDGPRIAPRNNVFGAAKEEQVWEEKNHAHENRKHFASPEGTPTLACPVRNSA